MCLRFQCQLGHQRVLGFLHTPKPSTIMPQRNVVLMFRGRGLGMEVSVIEVSAFPAGRTNHNAFKTLNMLCWQIADPAELVCAIG